MIHVSIASETVFHIGSFPVTNTLLTAWVVMAGLILFSIFFSRTLKVIPGGVQNIVEALLDGVIGFLQTIVGSRKKVEKYFAIVGTIFVFVLFSNWFGLLPGVGSVGFFEHNTATGESEAFVPLLRSVNSDLNMTLALALIVVVLSHIIGFTFVGAKGHLSKFFNFSSPVGFFAGLLEIIGEVAKIISFSFRLFGNVFAGEVLLVIISFFVPYLVPVPFLGLEIFVGFIQALVFAVLAMMFFASFEESHQTAHEEKHEEKHGVSHEPAH